MKRVCFLLTGIFFLAFTASAQTSADYFAGKWNVLLKGIPGGDARLIFALEKIDSSITGVVQDSTGKEISRITSAEVKENQVTLYFSAQGYDVNLLLTKKDDDHVTGSLMGMFDAEGDRIKEIKTK